MPTLRMMPSVVTMTGDAVRRVNALVAANPGALGLRIGVKKGGCAGMEYTMAVASEKGQMADLPWLKIYGTAPGKGAIVSFTMDGLHPHDIATIIDRSGVAVRAGHHCAQPLMDRLGVTAVARASFAMYNTKEEVDVLVDSLKRAHELFA